MGEVELQCEVGGAKPGAELEWRDAQGELILTNMVETRTRNPRTKTFSTVSTVKLTLTEDTLVTCGAYNEAFPDPRSSRPFRLRLNYKPRLSLNITDHEENTVTAGQDITIHCSAQAYPPVQSYKWFLDDREYLATTSTDTITLSNVSSDLHRSVIKCVAENKVGSSEVSSVLNVEFKTRIVEEPESVIAKHGETVTFSCLAESNSELEYIWVRGDNDKIVGVSQHLTLTAHDDTEDVYKCKVFVAGAELVSRPAHLRLIRAPVLRVVEERLVSLGDDIILQCHVSSLDSRTRVIWTRNNVPLDRDSLKHRSPKYDNNVDLVIYNVNINDFGEYGCFAENTVGHDQKNVVLGVHNISVREPDYHYPHSSSHRSHHHHDCDEEEASH